MVYILKKIISFVLVIVLLCGLGHAFQATSPDDRILRRYMPDISFEISPETDCAYDIARIGEPITNSNLHPEFATDVYDPFVVDDIRNFAAKGNYSPVCLMYHSIYENPYSSLTGLFVRPSEFEDHLKTLDSLGYSYLFADEFQPTDSPSVILTFDDGYSDNYTDMFPILKKYNAKATIFMVAGSIDCKGYLTSEQIKEMADSGLVRFASHTYSHQNLTSMSEKTIREEFESSKQILAELTGYETNAICYPAGNVNEEVALIAEEYFYFGYTTVNSSYTGDCDPLQIPRLRVSRGMTGKGLASRLG